MVRLLFFCLCVASAASCRSGGGASLRPPTEVVAPGRPISLPFAPPEHREVSELTVTSRTEELLAGPRKGEKSHEVVSASMRSSYQRSDGNWRLTQWVEAVEARHNGTPIQDRLVKLVTRFPIEVLLAADGTFVRLLNAGQVEAAIQQTFPDLSEREAVLQLFTSAAIEEQARREWDTKYGSFFNRRLDVGTAFHAAESWVTSTGREVAYLVERKVAGLAQTEHGPAVVLSIRCNGVAESPAEKEALQRGPARLVELLEPSVQCAGQQVVAESPFLPVRAWMKLTARPKPHPGEPELAIELTRETSLK